MEMEINKEDILTYVKDAYEAGVERALWENHEKFGLIIGKEHPVDKVSFIQKIDEQLERDNAFTNTMMNNTYSKGKWFLLSHEKGELLKLADEGEHFTVKTIMKGFPDFPKGNVGGSLLEIKYHMVKWGEDLEHMEKAIAYRWINTEDD